MGPDRTNSSPSDGWFPGIWPRHRWTSSTSRRGHILPVTFLEKCPEYVWLHSSSGKSLPGGGKGIGVIHGRVFMSVSLSEAVQQCDTFGRSQCENYKEAVLENRTPNFQTPIKKYKQVRLRKTATQKKLSYFKDHTSLFVSLHTRQGNLRLFFEHDRSRFCRRTRHRTNDRAPSNRLQCNNYRWWSPYSHDATKNMLNIWRLCC